jgi:hypothetical protein
MDIQLEPFAQRKGLGRHLMRTIEMIARKQVLLRGPDSLARTGFSSSQSCSLLRFISTVLTTKLSIEILR